MGLDDVTMNCGSPHCNSQTSIKRGWIACFCHSKNYEGARNLPPLSPDDIHSVWTPGLESLVQTPMALTRNSVEVEVYQQCFVVIKEHRVKERKKRGEGNCHNQGLIWHIYQLLHVCVFMKSCCNSSSADCWLYLLWSDIADSLALYFLLRSIHFKLISLFLLSFNRTYRLVAYRAYTFWVHHRLGRRIRRVIPSCVVWRIRRKFPSPDNIYQGYQDVEEAWQL